MAHSPFQVKMSSRDIAQIVPRSYTEVVMTNVDLSRAADPATPLAELMLLAQDSLDVARAVASNPAINDAVASVLSGRRNVRIDRALAGNSSTPVELLVHLGDKHAELVLTNPAFEFLLAADPSALTKIPDKSLSQLAASETIDLRCLVLMARLASSGSVATAVLENARTPPEALRHLESIKAIGGFDCGDIRWHVNFSSNDRQEWSRTLEEAIASRSNIGSRSDKEQVVLEQLARAGAIDSVIRSAGVRTASATVGAIVLAGTELPAATAHALASVEIEDARKALLRAVASRGPAGDSTGRLDLRNPDPVLSGIDPHGSLLGLNASNADVLEAVVRHRDWTISHCVGPGTPFPDMRPMRAASQHPRADVRVLEAMVDGAPFRARFAKVAAESHAATGEFLQRLCAMVDDPTVGDDWYTDRPREGTTAFAVMEVVASNGACPADLLRGFLGRGVPALDRAVARNPSIDLKMVADLAQRPDEKVRVAIAGRSDLPPELVQVLVGDNSKAVKVALAGSLSVTDESLVLAFCTDKLAAIRAAAAARLGSIPAVSRPKLLADKSAEVRIGFAERGDLSLSEQQALASDASAKVRTSLATNGKLLPDVVAQLVHDGAREVVTALAGNRCLDETMLPSILDRLVEFVIAEMKARGLELMAKSTTRPDLGTVVALAAASQTRSASHSIAITHPACPEDVLRKRARGGEWVDRALVACNPSTPEDVRAALRADWAWPVVEAATAITSS